MLDVRVMLDVQVVGYWYVPGTVKLQESGEVRDTDTVSSTVRGTGNSRGHMYIFLAVFCISWYVHVSP